MIRVDYVLYDLPPKNSVKEAVLKRQLFMVKVTQKGFDSLLLCLVDIPLSDVYPERISGIQLVLEINSDLPCPTANI